MASSQRSRRIGDQLRVLLAELLLRQVHDPRLREVQVTGVRITTDLNLATVSYSVFAGGEPARLAAAQALERARGYLRREVGRRIRLRVTPELRFEADRSIEYAAHIEEVLGSLGLNAGTAGADAGVEEEE